MMLDSSLFAYLGLFNSLSVITGLELSLFSSHFTVIFLRLLALLTPC